MSESELRAERKHIGMIFQHFNLLSSAPSMRISRFR